MINEVALVLLFGLFGWKTAVLYASTGLFIAIFAGWIIGKLKLERFVESWVYSGEDGKFIRRKYSHMERPYRCRISTAVKDIVAKVWIYIVIGISVGRVRIHGYVPQDMMASVMGKDAWWSVPAAVLLGCADVLKRGRNHSHYTGSSRKRAPHLEPRSRL